MTKIIEVNDTKELPKETHLLLYYIHRLPTIEDLVKYLGYKPETVYKLDKPNAKARYWLVVVDKPTKESVQIA